MFSAPTVYRSGSRTVEVLAGESHSAAWAYVTGSGPEPVSYRCAQPARRQPGAPTRSRVTPPPGATLAAVPALTP